MTHHGFAIVWPRILIVLAKETLKSLKKYKCILMIPSVKKYRVGYN